MHKGQDLPGQILPSAPLPIVILSVFNTTSCSFKTGFLSVFRYKEKWS